MTIPDRAKVKLVYHAIDTITNVPAFDQPFALNWVYQPGNFSPLADSSFSAQGQLTWARWFQNSFVGGSKIEVKITNNINRQAAGNEAPIFVCLIPWLQNNINTDNTDTAPYLSTPYNRHKMLPQNCSVPTTLRHYMSVKKLFGKGRCIDDEAFWGKCITVSSGAPTAGFDGKPTQDCYWHLYVANADNAGGVIDVDITYEVKITYYVTLFGRWQLIK